VRDNSYITRGYSRSYDFGTTTSQFGGQYGVQGYSNAGFYLDSVQLKRVALFNQAILIGAANQHELRFNGFLSANDEIVLRARIRQVLAAQRDASLLNPYLSGGIAGY